MAPHFLLMPLPELGHSGPMLSLASHLASLGCNVTFLIAQKAPLAAASSPQDVAGNGVPNAQHCPLQHPQSAEPSANGIPNARHSRSQETPSTDSADVPGANGSINPAFASNLHLRTLPYTGVPSSLTENSSRFDVLKDTLAGLVERQGLVEQIVQELNSSEAPIACIICDILLCSWVMPLAKRQSIPSVAFMPCSLTNFYLAYLMMKEMSEEVDRVRSALGMPAWSAAPPPTEELQKRFREVKRVFWGAMDDIEMSSHVLINSCKGLDTAVLDVLSASTLNFYFVGPLFPALEVNADRQAMVGEDIARKAGCRYAEDMSCLPWLDTQDKGSVLLIAFGSEVTPDVEQVQELAMGIEASGCKFLWAVRPDAHMPPKDFLQRTQNVGMCISWVPQRMALQHAAVGGFLTHCGWNSTVESIFAGVPMLCLPLNGDQYLNAHIVEAVWKVGLRLGPPNTLVLRADVERSVRELLRSEELRLKVGQLRDEVHGALPESKSSISTFIEEIRSHQVSKS